MFGQKARRIHALEAKLFERDQVRAELLGRMRELERRLESREAEPHSRAGAKARPVSHLRSIKDRTP
jgi:hypothetical protein